MMQGMHLITIGWLMCTWQETVTSQSTDSRLMTGRALRLWWSGWNNFDMPPPRCQPPSFLCSHQPMQHSVVSRSISKPSYQCYLRILLQRSRKACSMLTASSVTTTISLINHHYTSMWQWHHSPPTSHLIFTVLDPRISYKGLFSDFEDDGALAEYLESSKANLYSFYNDKYLPNHSTTPFTSSQATTLILIIDIFPWQRFTSEN